MEEGFKGVIQWLPSCSVCFCLSYQSQEVPGTCRLPFALRAWPKLEIESGNSSKRKYSNWLFWRKSVGEVGPCQLIKRCLAVAKRKETGGLLQKQVKARHCAVSFWCLVFCFLVASSQLSPEEDVQNGTGIYHEVLANDSGADRRPDPSSMTPRLSVFCPRTSLAWYLHGKPASLYLFTAFKISALYSQWHYQYHHNFELSFASKLKLSKGAMRSRLQKRNYF